MAAEWYYTTNKQQMGPVSWQELRELAEVGIIKPHDMVWTDGMDEWVKAINQSGLFTEGDEKEAIAASPKKKSAYVEAKPPPGRRTRKRVEEEEDDEDDEREERKKNRKREEASAKRGIGFRIFLGLGVVVVVLLFLVCGVGGLVWIAWPNKNPAPPKPGPIAGPGPVVGAGLVRDNFVWNNLGEAKHLEKSYNFTAGRRVIITVTNNLPNPNTNVDVMVFRGGGPNQPQNTALHWDKRRPQEDRNCRLDFVVPDNGIYWLRVANFGPGMANACQVSVQEQ